MRRNEEKRRMRKNTSTSLGEKLALLLGGMRRSKPEFELNMREQVASGASLSWMFTDEFILCAFQVERKRR